MEENIIMVPGSGTKVIVRDVKQEIETAFLDYSMSVIVARALPDVRDGLKPVHRRILYTMHERGNDPQHPYRKSADTVGAVLGSYHPHGDASVYDAMVRLAQDFSLRYPLVDGQGNFGSVDGDPPAAYRYTEARMSKMACEMLTDIEKDTIDWDPNFDETKKEPHVLPSRFPNLLVNGSQGIAVGMATNIPPHNLREIVNGMVALMDDPEIDLAGLMEYVKGPDFPTGGIIMGRSGIRAAYATGRGKITLRGRAEIIEKKNGRYEILINEIPYMVNKTRLIESIADLVKDKRIEGISDLNDESSSRTGMKIVIEIKKDANPQVVLNQLYRFTQLQDTVGVIMLALDDGVPKIMSLKTMMERYIEFQMQVIRRRTAFELKKAKEREHILEGLHKAVDIVDEIIATIRACKGGFAEARQAVMDNFGFDELQADAIVKLQLGRLAGLEILKIEQELGELREAIADYEDILANDEHVKRIVKTDLTALADKYGDERRTSIETVSGEVDIEDLIPEETCVFTLTHEGYIKRTTLDTYQAQNRGGRGVQGMTQKDDDFTEELFVGSTHDYMLFMTNQGRVYRLKGYQVPLPYGHGHVPLGSLVQRRLMRTALDEAAHVLLDGGQRALDAVIDVAQDAGAEGHGQRAARALDRLACFQTAGLLIDLDGGFPVVHADDLADKACLADIDHLHHFQISLALDGDNGAVDAVNCVFHSFAPQMLISRPAFSRNQSCWASRRASSVSSATMPFAGFAPFRPPSVMLSSASRTVPAGSSTFFSSGRSAARAVILAFSPKVSAREAASFCSQAA